MKAGSKSLIGLVALIAAILLAIGASDAPTGTAAANRMVRQQEGILYHADLARPH